MSGLYLFKTFCNVSCGWGNDGMEATYGRIAIRPMLKKEPNVGGHITMGELPFAPTKAPPLSPNIPPNSYEP